MASCFAAFLSARRAATTSGGGRGRLAATDENVLETARFILDVYILRVAIEVERECRQPGQLITDSLFFLAFSKQRTATATYRIPWIPVPLLPLRHHVAH